MNRRSSTLLSLGAAAVVMAVAASAQDATGPWKVRTIHGAVWTGGVSVVDGALTVQTNEGARSIQLEEIQDLAHEAAVEGGKTYPRGGRIWLRSGVDFPISSFRGDDRAATVGSPIVEGALEYPVRSLAAIRFPREEAADDTRFQAALAAPANTDDYLLAFNPEGAVQRLSVKVVSLSETGVTVEFAGRQQPELPFARVYGIVFAQLSGAAPDPLPKPRAQIRLRSGEELFGQVRTLDDRAVVLATAEGVDLSVPTASVRRVDFVTDKLVYLSDMEPTKVDQVPAFDRVWPWMVDRSPSGATMMLANQAFARGLVLFPKTRLEYSIEGRFDHFETTLGIEDRAGPQAHAVFRVFADGQKVYESPAMTVGSDPEVIKLSIAGIAVLAIEADFGKNFDLGDHCVFAEARVTQK